jgi:thiol-disulfide isomerase/thioredoxin
MSKLTTLKTRQSVSFLKPMSRAAFLALASAVFVTGCAFGGAEAGDANPAIGAELTNLKLLGLTGEAKDLELPALKDRVVLIHFWGAWCPPCVAEIPHIAAIGEKFQEAPDFALLAIASQPGLNPDLDLLRKETDAFLNAKKLDLPTYADVNDITRSTFHKIAGWRGFPATMLIDKNGAIQGVWFGYEKGDIEQMEQLIAGLLGL